MRISLSHALCGLACLLPSVVNSSDASSRFLSKEFGLDSLIANATFFDGQAGQDADASPLRGPYATKSMYLTYDKMDSSDNRILVIYPDVAAADGSSQKFPFISYAHGAGNLITDYQMLTDGIASFGFVIAVHGACQYGCIDDPSSLSLDPSGFAHYYKQQLLSVDYFLGSAGDPASSFPFSLIDASVGAGVAGHSMGGQSTVFSASYGNATAHDIRAASMHHAYTHQTPGPTVPFLAFTGESDNIAWPFMTSWFSDAADERLPRGLVNKWDAGHFEPEDDWIWGVSTYNPLFSQYTAAWFKLYLEGKKTEFGIDFDNMIYGTGEDSVCGGQDGAMAECTMKR